MMMLIRKRRRRRRRRDETREQGRGKGGKKVKEIEGGDKSTRRGWKREDEPDRDKDEVLMGSKSPDEEGKEGEERR